MAQCAALILAGGSGSRLGSDIPKQYLSLNGVSILRRTVDTFLAHPDIDAVQVVIGAKDQELYNVAIGGADVRPSVTGGASRQESGRIGLEALTDDAPDYVLIHDAARPFIDAATIDRVLSALVTSSAVLPGVPVTDTLKRSTGDPPIVSENVDRRDLWRAQTPQGFRYIDILDAHRTCASQGLTDDASIAEHAGLSVALVRGSEDNFKITTVDDLERAQRMTEYSSDEFRIGTGFDVHALVDGDHVILCGVRIDHSHGLEGHSDADVAMHAVTDALLGAIAEGDIGTHFPPSDDQWCGAASSVFLEHAGRLISERGGRIGNIDVTIICEAPKISPHREAMTLSLAGILGIAPDRVSVKATTTEKLGFTGRGQGIAAQASAIVRLG